MRISDWSSDVCSSDLPGGTRTQMRARLSRRGSAEHQGSGGGRRVCREADGRRVRQHGFSRAAQGHGKSLKPSSSSALRCSHKRVCEGAGIMTKTLLRSAIAAIIGIVVAFGLIWLAQYAGSELSPDVYDPTDRKSTRLNY